MDYVLETFSKRLKHFFKTCYQEQINSMIRLEKVLKTSFQEVSKMSWRRLSKTSCICLEDVFMMSWRRFCKTSWRRLEDVWPRWIYWSWSRRLEDIFWRRRRKTSSRCLHQDECLLGRYWTSPSLYWKSCLASLWSATLGWNGLEESIHYRRF